MPTSRDLPTDRLAVGQLLGRLLRQFREELFAGADPGGHNDLRMPHLQIFGNIGIDGIRLTELASRAQLSLSATSEFVNDLQRLGYLERRPDPIDGRAKLIFPTPRGRRLLDDAGDRVAGIEQRWAELVGPGKFASSMRTLQDLLDATAAGDAAHTDDDPPDGRAGADR